MKSRLKDLPAYKPISVKADSSLSSRTVKADSSLSSRNKTPQVLWMELLDLVNWNLTPWNQQRTLNNDRVIELIRLFTDNLNTRQELCIRQPIVLCRLKDQPYIVDGQHRYWALSTMLRDKLLTSSYKVLILLIECETDAELRFEFNNINNVTPMPKCYLQPVSLIDEAVTKLALLYSNLRVSDKRLNRPNFNIDLLKSALIEANFIEKYKVESVEALIALFQTLQQEYKALSVVDFAWKVRVSAKDKTLNNIYAKMLTKPDLHFLGLFKPEHTFIWLADLKSISLKPIS